MPAVVRNSRAGAKIRERGPAEDGVAAFSPRIRVRPADPPDADHREGSRRQSRTRSPTPPARLAAAPPPPPAPTAAARRPGGVETKITVVHRAGQARWSARPAVPR